MAVSEERGEERKDSERRGRMEMSVKRKKKKERERWRRMKRGGGREANLTKSKEEPQGEWLSF